MSDLLKAYHVYVYEQRGKVSTKVVELEMLEPGSGKVLVNLCANNDVSVTLLYCRCWLLL